MKQLFLAFVFIISSANTYADVFLELGFESGDETLIKTDASFDDGYEPSDDIDAGGGIKIAIGYQHFLRENKNRSLSFIIGELSEDADDDSVDAEYEVKTFDVIYNRYSSSSYSSKYNVKYVYQTGAGITYHVDPEYSEKSNGVSTSTNYDDSLGLVFLVSTNIAITGVRYGIKLTLMEYEVEGKNVDANSVGFFITFGQDSLDPD